jgi:hypothetical protein
MFSSLQNVQSSVRKLVSDNATTILTAGGVVGTVTTAILAGRAGYKAAEIITFEERKHFIETHKPLEDWNSVEPLSKTDKVKLVGLQFVLPVMTGVGTIAAIVFAHRMSAQKAAALAAAYGYSEKQFREYKEKVEEKLTGVKKEQLEDELAQDRVNNTPGSNQIVVIEGEVLCFDASGGRYFMSTMEKIRQAVNTANEEILNHDSVSLSEFYDMIGLKPTSWSDDIGFNMDNRVDLKYTTTTADNGRPCIVIDFVRLPKPDFHRAY